MPEWDGMAIILGTRPFGEADAVATVLTGEHGLRRGLARGARGRTRSAIWQAGNIVQARWIGRLEDQLGQITAELVHPSAALAMGDAAALMVLSAFCAVAESVLPPHTPHEDSFAAAMRLIAGLESAPPIPAYVRWEAVLLAELGYGLDLSSCAMTGMVDNLRYVSPRTGRAVTEEAAGLWKERLLKLPAFLTSDAVVSADDCYDGLRLTGHFLARDAFGQLHHAPPEARQRLVDHAAKLVSKPSVQDKA